MQDVQEVVLRDLESVLRESLGDEVVVEEYSTKSIMLPGDNYGSTILGVEATIRRGKGVDPEELHLIAKMLPPTELQRMIFDSPYSFRKEIFMYKEIFPEYNRLELENGYSEEELFRVLPRFYGSRLTLDPKVDFTDDAVILLENLKPQGYASGDRRLGYDLEHAKLAISAMARFHALGIATKMKRPEYFEELKRRCKCLQFKGENFADSTKAFLAAIGDDPEVSQYLERCQAAFDRGVDQAWHRVPEEPWSTIIHSDFWVNNLLFKRDESGRPVDVKFVDFQNYLFLSPLQELVFFIFVSVQDEVKAAHVEELFDTYYCSFVSVLERLGCDVSPFSKDQFVKKLSEDAALEFVHCMFMLKVLTLEVDPNQDQPLDVSRVMLSKGSDDYMRRVRTLIKFYVARNWI
ncbi:uncharacterized protein LOC105696064 [Orussus abietinus]|uniref:uncharacterized protein LOC105696064 n=1 Tax=Orussus abietinus TaxID=222816 RepID=UPI000626D1B3|nr:uncharacterized protein LOC105696064 [Orussus abietinus]